MADASTFQHAGGRPGNANGSLRDSSASGVNPPTAGESSPPDPMATPLDMRAELRQTQLRTGNYFHIDIPLLGKATLPAILLLLN